MRCCSHLEGSTKPELKHRPIETKIKNRKQSQKKNTMNTWAENFQLEPSQKAQKHTSFLPPHVCLAWKRLAKAFATVIPQTVHHASYLPSVHKKNRFQFAENGPFFCPKKKKPACLPTIIFQGLLLLVSERVLWGTPFGDVHHLHQFHHPNTQNTHHKSPSGDAPITAISAAIIGILRRFSDPSWAYKRTPNQNE